MIENIWCVFVSSENLICNGTEYIKYEAPLNIYDLYFWVYLAIYICLTLGAGTMSGLTLGLLSLDTLSLEVLMRTGIEPEAKYAKKLFPIIKRHHILLVTLLLGNAICVESMPIFLDRISDPITAIIASVTAVLLFGEIIPQALCKRYGLAIGYYMRPIVYLLMGISIVISYPVSKLLDCVFGHDNSNYYRRPQLKALIDLHGPSGLLGKPHDRSPNEDQKNFDIERSISSHEDTESKSGDHQLTLEEVSIIKGALDLTAMTAKDALVPLDQVFMLSDTSVLDKNTIRQILQVAHSRIPIYHKTERRLIQGLLLTKMLIQYNLSDTVPISSLVESNKCFQPLRYVTETTPLYDLLQLFKTGRTGHMAVVVKDSIAKEQLEAIEEFYSVKDPRNSSNLVSVFPPVIGIITLEDVLEKLIQSEIQDEGDIFRNDMCRQLMYKQKLRWAKFARNNQHDIDESKTSKSMGCSVINDENRNTGRPIQKYFDDQALLIKKGTSKIYHTFKDV